MAFYYREAGVGFASSPPVNPQFDCNRTELLKLLLTCFSEAMYLPPTGLLTPLMPLKYAYNILNVQRRKRHLITEMLLIKYVHSIPAQTNQLLL